MQSNRSVIEQYQVKEITFPPQHVVLRQDGIPSGVYVLASGLVKVVRTTSIGQLFTLGAFERGEILGDVEAIMNINHFCTVVALTECTFYHIASPTFLTMLAEQPAFNLLVHTSMASKLLNTSGKAAIQSTNRLYYSLLLVLRELSRLNELTISKSLLAEFLGTSVRNLNRLLAPMEQEQVLQVNGGEVKRIDLHLLSQKIKAYENAVQ